MRSVQDLFIIIIIFKNCFNGLRPMRLFRFFGLQPLRLLKICGKVGLRPLWFIWFTNSFAGTFTPPESGVFVGREPETGVSPPSIWIQKLVKFQMPTFCRNDVGGRKRCQTHSGLHPYFARIWDSVIAIVINFPISESQNLIVRLRPESGLKVALIFKNQ